MSGGRPGIESIFLPTQRLIGPPFVSASLQPTRLLRFIPSFSYSTGTKAFAAVNRFRGDPKPWKKLKRKRENLLRDVFDGVTSPGDYDDNEDIRKKYNLKLIFARDEQRS